jgi:hypothetical protein
MALSDLTGPDPSGVKSVVNTLIDQININSGNALGIPGPGTGLSVDGALVVWDGTTGGKIKDVGHPPAAGGVQTLTTALDTTHYFQLTIAGTTYNLCLALVG